MPIPGEHEVENPELTATLRTLGQSIAAGLPPGHGFFLCLFNNTNQDLFYISDCDRTGIINLLRECLSKLSPLG